MKIRISELRRVVKKAFLELNNSKVVNESYRRLSVIDTSPRDPGDREPMKGSISKGKAAQEGSTEDMIDDLRAMSEFNNLDEFISMKLEDDDLSYNFMELQALARNMTATRTKNKAVAVASKSDVDAIRKSLENEMGFKYIVREPEKQVRGMSGNQHGTHPFAGSGGGGSGFSSDMGGDGGFTSFGGGPGAIGGGTPWKPEDKKNLPMGARRVTKKA